MKEFNVTKPYPPEILEKLHKLHVEMLKDFQRVCDKYNLKYFAVFGTAIGAVRHQGFIPWDDDIDVGMLREDYERFLQVAEKELGERYQILSPIKDKRYAGVVVKLQRKGTLFVSHVTRHLKCEQRIFLDIFPFDYAAPTERLRKRQLYATTFLDRLIYLCGTPSPIIPIKGPAGLAAKAVCRLAHYGLKLFHVSPRFLFRLFEKECVRYNRFKGEYVTGFGQPTALKKMFARKNMFPLKEVPFEDASIHILNNNDEELRKVYGDYMKIPPKEKQVNHAPYIIQFEGEKPVITK